MLKDKTWTYEEISKSHIKYLRFVGFLPFHGKTFKFYGTKLVDIYWFFIILSYNAIYLGYGIRMARKKIFEAHYLEEQIIVESISIRYLLYYCKREHIVKLFDSCKALWSNTVLDESKIIRPYERAIYYIRNLSLTSIILITIAYYFSALFLVQSVSASNETQSKVVPLKFFMDVKDDVTFTIVIIYQAIIGLSVSTLCAGMQVVEFFVTLMPCGYLKIIRERFMNLNKYQDQIKYNYCDNNKKEIELVHIKVVTCVKFHQQILEYCENVESFMRNIYFVSVFSTIYTISITGFNILKKDPDYIKYFTILLMQMLQFFSYQWSPEVLLTESRAIAEAAYFASLKQVGRQEETNKILHFLIMRAQKPVQLTAGGFIKLSMETFGIMIKSSFSFFALLRNYN